MKKSFPETGTTDPPKWLNQPSGTSRSGKGAFTLIEILLALALSGLALTATLHLLNQFVRDVDSTARDTWVEIERARFITFLEGILTKASRQDSLAWIPPARDPDYRGLDWVLALPSTDSAIGQTEEGRPILAAAFELGWSRSEGLVLREAIENSSLQAIPFRPLLEENPFDRVVFYRFVDSPMRFEEIRPPRSLEEEDPGEPRILKLVFTEASERIEGLWIYLPRSPGQLTGTEGPGTPPPETGEATQPGQPPELRLEPPRERPDSPRERMPPTAIDR